MLRVNTEPLFTDIMKKTFVHWGGLFIVLMAFSSCFCPIIEFAEKDCFSVLELPDGIREIDAELCYFGSYKKEWFFYQYIVVDSIMTLNSKQVEVNYKGKSVNYKLYHVRDGKWVKSDTIEIKDSVLLKFSLRNSMEEGTSCQIVEKGFSIAGNSLVTSIRFPIVFHQTQRHMSNDSRIQAYMKEHVRQGF